MSAIVPAYDFPTPSRVGMHGGIGLITGTATLVTYETTGGVACDISAKFLSLYHVAFAQMTGYVIEYDYTNNKMLVYEEEAVAAGGPLSEVGDGALALIVSFLAVGSMPAVIGKV